MVKVVTLFLIFMMVLAMFGKLRLPWSGKGGNGTALPRPRRCGDCGRYNVTGGPCRHCRDGTGRG